MSDIQRPRNWVVWIVANSAAGALDGIIVDRLGPGWLLAFGVCSGVAQWLVLHRLVGINGWWILATAFSSFLALEATLLDFLMGVLVFYLLNLAWRLLQLPTNQPSTELMLGGPFTAHLIAGIVTAPSGALIGFLQRRSQPAARFEGIHWVRLFAAGTGLAVAVSGLELLDPWQCFDGLVFQFSPSVAGTLFGLAYAAITGYGVTTMLTPRRTS